MDAGSSLLPYSARSSVKVRPACHVISLGPIFNRSPCSWGGGIHSLTSSTGLSSSNAPAPHPKRASPSTIRGLYRPYPGQGARQLQLLAQRVSHFIKAKWPGRRSASAQVPSTWLRPSPRFARGLRHGDVGLQAVPRPSAPHRAAGRGPRKGSCVARLKLPFLEPLRMHREPHRPPFGVSHLSHRASYC